MEPKFKNGTAVKLKDDVVYGEVYNSIRLLSAHIERGKKYTIKKPHMALSAYLLNETDIFVGEDALELWSEPQQEVKSEIEPLMTFNTKGLQSNEIEPLQFEIYKAIITGFAANPSLCYDHDGRICLPIANAIAFSKESLHLLREEKNK